MCIRDRCSTVPSKLKFAYSRPPAAMPINSEEYTSFVMSASVMAMSGGSRDPVSYTHLS